MRWKTYAILSSVCGLAIGLGGLRGADLTSEVKSFKGMPSLFVNGKPTSSLICFTSYSTDLGDFLKAGFKIVDISLPFDWVGPEEYDFKSTDMEMEKYLEQDPHLLVLPRIAPAPGKWWCDKFPQDITRKSDGSPAGMFGEPCYFSFASEKYRTLSHRALTALVTHLETKYGNRILGYFICNGVYGEWFSWNAYWEVPPGTPPPKHFGVEDYSAPAQAAFRQWLKEKYGGKIERLQHAWGNPKLTFATAQAPSEEVRRHPTHGIFFDPEISSQVLDYF
jgi:beta-galactosidase GanA